MVLSLVASTSRRCLRSRSSRLAAAAFAGTVSVAGVLAVATEAPAQSAIQTYCGRHYDDLNQNGIQDAGERSLVAVRVNVVDANGVVRFALTGDNGEFCIPAIPAGRHVVHFDDQPLAQTTIIVSAAGIMTLRPGSSIPVTTVTTTTMAVNPALPLGPDVMATLKPGAASTTINPALPLTARPATSAAPRTTVAPTTAAARTTVAPTTAAPRTTVAPTTAAPRTTAIPRTTAAPTTKPAPVTTRPTTTVARPATTVARPTTTTAAPTTTRTAAPTTTTAAPTTTTAAPTTTTAAPTTTTAAPSTTLATNPPSTLAPDTIPERLPLAPDATKNGLPETGGPTLWQTGLALLAAGIGLWTLAAERSRPRPKHLR